MFGNLYVFFFILSLGVFILVCMAITALILIIEVHIQRLQNCLAAPPTWISKMAGVSGTVPINFQRNKFLFLFRGHLYVGGQRNQDFFWVVRGGDSFSMYETRHQNFVGSEREEQKFLPS